MNDLTRRIEKLERALEPEEGPLIVVRVEQDANGELVAAVTADRRMEREPGESAQAFRERVFGPKGPRYTIRMVPDSGPLARMEGGGYV